jgi:ABC-type lipoprotein release transport system permease subunit
MTPKLIDESILKQRVAGNNVVIKSWKQLNPEMAVVLEFHDGMIKFFFLIIAVTIMMTILTPVRMLWQERFKEIKMMNIVGVSTRVIWKLGFNEVVIMIGLSGFFSSLFLGTIIGYQSYNGVDFRFLNDGIAIERAGIKLPGIIYPLLTLNQIIITFLFVIFVLGISYIWSIHRTIRRLEIES